MYTYQIDGYFLHYFSFLPTDLSPPTDTGKSMMINMLFFTFIETYVVAMRCYGYCSLVRVTELPTGENQNSKTWPTIYRQIQPVRSRGQKISILGHWLLDYGNMPTCSEPAACLHSVPSNQHRADQHVGI